MVISGVLKGNNLHLGRLGDLVLQALLLTGVGGRFSAKEKLLKMITFFSKKSSPLFDADRRRQIRFEALHLEHVEVEVAQHGRVAGGRKLQTSQKVLVAVAVRPRGEIWSFLNSSSIPSSLLPYFV